MTSLNLLVEQVTQVARGSYFIVALSVDVKVFTIGKESSLYLGHGSRWAEYEPHQVEALADERLTSISYGSVN